MYIAGHENAFSTIIYDPDNSGKNRFPDDCNSTARKYILSAPEWQLTLKKTESRNIPSSIREMIKSLSNCILTVIFISYNKTCRHHQCSPQLQWKYKNQQHHLNSNLETKSSYFIKRRLHTKTWNSQFCVSTINFTYEFRGQNILKFIGRADLQ